MRFGYLVFIRYIQQSDCIIGYTNTSNFVKNTLLRIVFSTLFLVFGYPYEKMSLVFDILRQRLDYELEISI